jgi:hypothetical protein
MKKIKSVFSSVLFLAVGAFAQNEDVVPSLEEEEGARFFSFSAGLHLSVGYNTYWDDAFADDLWGPSVNAGATLLFPFTETLLFHPELSFAYRMASYETSEPFGDEEYTVKETLTQLNLDLPLLFRLKIHEGLFAELGPQFSLNISDEYKHDDNYDDPYTTESTDRSAFEFAGVAGIGYTMMKQLELDFRVVLGISKVYDSDDPKMSPKTFQLQVGATYWVM